MYWPATPLYCEPRGPDVVALFSLGETKHLCLSTSHPPLVLKCLVRVRERRANVRNVRSAAAQSAEVTSPDRRLRAAGHEWHPVGELAEQRDREPECTRTVEPILE